MDQGDNQQPWLPIDDEENGLWLDSYVWGDRATNGCWNHVQGTYEAQNTCEALSIWDLENSQRLWDSSNLSYEGDLVASNSTYLDTTVNDPSNGLANHYHAPEPRMELGETATPGSAEGAFSFATIQAQPTLPPEANRESFVPSLNIPWTIRDISQPLADQKTRHKAASGTSSTRKSGNISKATKPRLSCTHAGCNWTSPRMYELERHKDNSHERVFIPCCVYGCNRVGKPVARVDKFREHMKKHRNAHTFVCVVVDCPVGPFDRDQLCQHMNTEHDLERCNKELLLKERLLGISLRISLCDNGSRIIEENGNCPLSFLGCTFQVPHLALPFVRSSSKDHIQTHDIAERGKGYQSLLKHGYDKYRLHWGMATCPVCKELMFDQRRSLQDFTNHVNTHSKEQRHPHIIGLWQSLSPFAFWFLNDLQTIRNEYQEATGLDPST